MLPHTDRGLQDKRARDQIQTLVICLKKTTLSALRRCVEKGVCGPRDDAPIMGRESARSSHKRCLVHTCGYGSTMRREETQCSFRLSHSYAFEVFLIRVFIHSNSIGFSTVGYGFLRCDDIQTYADCREKGGLEQNSNRRRPQLYIKLQRDRMIYS